uniref:Uncharacterized protein n=1 Tax=Acrobeloides nanus TaxID=290746 RepID=A0A914CY34_9BILA
MDVLVDRLARLVVRDHRRTAPRAHVLHQVLLVHIFSAEIATSSYAAPPIASPLPCSGIGCSQNSGCYGPNCAPRRSNYALPKNEAEFSNSNPCIAGNCNLIQLQIVPANSYSNHGISRNNYAITPTGSSGLGFLHSSESTFPNSPHPGQISPEAQNQAPQGRPSRLDQSGPIGSSSTNTQPKSIPSYSDKKQRNYENGPSFNPEANFPNLTSSNKTQNLHNNAEELKYKGASDQQPLQQNVRPTNINQEQNQVDSQLENPPALPNTIDQSVVEAENEEYENTYEDYVVQERPGLLAGVAGNSNTKKEAQALKSDESVSKKDTVVQRNTNGFPNLTTNEHKSISTKFQTSIKISVRGKNKSQEVETSHGQGIDTKLTIDSHNKNENGSP